MSRISAFILLVIGLIGCAPLAPENQSVVVDVYPIEYQMSLIVDGKHLAKASDEWQRFYAKHELAMLNREVEFFYATSLGKKAAMRWRNELIKKGAQRENLVIMKKADLAKFDVKVQLMEYTVVTPICKPQAVTKYSKPPVGCPSNSNLWQSLVYPQDALLSEK